LIIQLKIWIRNKEKIFVSDNKIKNIDFGKEVEIEIPKYGDLIMRPWINVTLPEIYPEESKKETEFVLYENSDIIEI
jgi:hypothetical protein